MKLSDEGGFAACALEAVRLQLRDVAVSGVVERGLSDEAQFGLPSRALALRAPNIPLAGLTDRRLEQIVQGHSVATGGKRVDALLRTRGIVSSLCFVEVKTHKTPLLQRKPYRASCWAASDELAGGVAQVHGTVASAADTIRAKLALEDELGFPTGEEAFNYLPRSFLVVGSLREFAGDHGVNQEQYRSFELLRRNIVSPEIITFDELYERARFIVTQSET